MDIQQGFDGRSYRRVGGDSHGLDALGLALLHRNGGFRQAERPGQEVLNSGVGLALLGNGADADFEESLPGCILAPALDGLLRGAGLDADAEFRPARNQPPAAQNGTSEIRRGMA